MRVLLVTGPPGSGKTTVLLEIGRLLEAGTSRYALVDLDWLCWARTDPGRGTVSEVLTWNLASVLASFRDAGVWEIATTRFLPDPSHLAPIEAALPPGAKLTVVRLEVPEAELERRLAARDTPEELAEHLALARAEVAVPDALTIPADRPAAEVALEILRAVGWVSAAP